MTHACTAPPWCPECLALLKYWGAKKSTSPALLADLLKAHALPDRESAANATIAATRTHYDLPPVIPRHPQRYSFPFTAQYEGYNPDPGPTQPFKQHKRREVAVGASHPPESKRT